MRCFSGTLGFPRAIRYRHLFAENPNGQTSIHHPSRRWSMTLGARSAAIPQTAANKWLVPTGADIPGFNKKAEDTICTAYRRRLNAEATVTHEEFLRRRNPKSASKLEICH